MHRTLPSPIAARPCPGGTATFVRRCLLSDKREASRAEKAIGGERGRAIYGSDKRHRFGRRGKRLRPSSHRRLTKEAAQCKRLTRAQTTGHFTVDAAVPTPQRSVKPARGEGEGNLARTRKRAHQSVSVKSLHHFTLPLQSTWNQRVAKQKW